MSRKRALGTACCATVLVAACSAAPGAAPVSTPSATSSTQSTPAPTAAPLPSAATPEPGIPECDPDTAAGIGETLAAQLAAFAADDFRAAFQLASESFRSSVDLKGFRAIILDGYPEVAAAASHRLVECRQPSESSASALVTVSGENGMSAQLGYRFVLEPDGWHVDGASVLGRQAVQSA